MLNRTLGKTGLDVSILGYGASPLGNEFGTTDPAEGVRAVHAAIDQGINYFDVAPYYGRTLAETRLGKALVGHRNQIILATKACRYDQALPDGFDFSAERVVRSIEESLMRLQTDHIDVYQIHDVEFGHKEQILNETIPAMLRLKETGKVRFVGVTGYGLNILKDLIEASEVDTVLSYCRYNLLDDALENRLGSLIEEKGLGLINASPLHMRVLTEKGAPEWHPSPASVIQAGREAAVYCHERGVDIADLAMQYALGYERAATTLVGMSKTRHVEKNIANVGITPDPELLAGVVAILGPVKNIPWQSGLPENFDDGAMEARA